MTSSGPVYKQAKFKSCSVRSWTWLPGPCEHQSPGTVIAEFTGSETHSRIHSKMGTSSHCSLFFTHYTHDLHTSDSRIYIPEPGFSFKLWFCPLITYTWVFYTKRVGTKIHEALTANCTLNSISIHQNS